MTTRVIRICKFIDLGGQGGYLSVIQQSDPCEITIVEIKTDLFISQTQRLLPGLTVGPVENVRDWSVLG